MSFCPHTNLTPADADGTSVCADCGTLVSSSTLTLTEFDRAVAAITCAPHTLDCVRVERGEWFCAPGCPAAH